MSNNFSPVARAETPGGTGSVILLEDNISGILMEDGSSFILLEG
jgi:hypothetical protein